ncbi:hypothetical protein B0H13DRAFT_1854932 [Mycena leptocephala]|nr:hypothetical protein B0H13DRAFT_1854932 [Mycena leptocephala]
MDIDNGKAMTAYSEFGIGGDNWNRATTKIHRKSTADDHLLGIHGLFASLVCFNSSQVVTNPSTYLEAAPITEISLRDTHYEVTGQILSLSPFLSDDGALGWAWATDFVSFESAKAKQAISAATAARMRHLSITVNGRLALPLTPAEVGQATLQGILKLPIPDAQLEDTSPKTWCFNGLLDSFPNI